MSCGYGTILLQIYSPVNVLAWQTQSVHACSQVYAWKDFDVRNDDHIRDAVKRSNVVINLIAKEKETWNFGFEEVNVDIPWRIAKIAAENPLTERFLHFSCLGASKTSASRRLRTKVRAEQCTQPIGVPLEPGEVGGEGMALHCGLLLRWICMRIITSRAQLVSGVGRAMSYQARVSLSPHGCTVTLQIEGQSSGHGRWRMPLGQVFRSGHVSSSQGHGCAG